MSATSRNPPSASHFSESTVSAEPICAALSQFALRDALGQFALRDALGQFALRDALGRFAVPDTLGLLRWAQVA